VAGWWFNWYLAETKGEFYIKACLGGPLGSFGGLLMLSRPESAINTTPLGSGTPRQIQLTMRLSF
jgi:hypothetical protein